MFLPHFIVPLGSFSVLISMHFFSKDNSLSYYKVSEPFFIPTFQYLRVKTAAYNSGNLVICFCLYSFKYFVRSRWVLWNCRQWKTRKLWHPQIKPTLVSLMHKTIEPKLQRAAGDNSIFRHISQTQWCPFAHLQWCTSKCAYFYHLFVSFRSTLVTISLIHVLKC